MKRITASIALLSFFLANPALAQRSAPANSLARALATFSAADSNKDGKLSADEIAAVPISKSDFLAHDHDKDGSWSRDEFLIFYRQRLVLASQPVGADLESETARIHALRKTKSAEEARAKAGQSASQSASQSNGTVKSAQPSTVDGHLVQQVPSAAVVGGATSANAQSTSLAAIEAGLQTALDSLEKRAAAAHATREDFQKVHDQLIARARAAANQGGPEDVSAAYGSEAYRKMLQSLDRLEKRANEGAYSREDYQEFRDMIIRRSRLIASKGANDEKGAENSLSPELAAIESGLQNALDGLEKRAAGGHASREDFQKVRDQMIARARAAANANGAAGLNGQAGSDTHSKMMQALDRLEKRATEGAYSREEYQELREMFIHRAREIQAAKAGEGAGPSDQRRQAAPPNTNGVVAPPAQPQRAGGATEPARVPNPQPTPVRGAQETKDAPKPDAPKPQRPPPASESPSKGDGNADAQRPPHASPPR